MTKSKKAAALAAKGVYVARRAGNMKVGSVSFTRPRCYEYRGKVATTRFERDSLREYAEVFKTTRVDAAYCIIPRPD